MKKLLLISLLVISGWAKAGIPMPDLEDRVRLAEAFSLAGSVQDSVWEGWSEVPFVILLVTPGHEYLVRHPYPSDDFVSLGHDEVIGEEVFARPNSGAYSLGFLATFPAVNGVNTVVIGQPGNTGKTSTQWVITALHEHFHQLQYTRPWYYEAVDALGLSGGDQTGMWQLNYPFPYESPPVVEAISNYRTALLEVLNEMQGVDAQATDAYRDARRELRDLLSEADYRYLSFQLWQEGIARYTEHTVARAAVELHQPAPEFKLLEDYIPYRQASQQLEKQLRTELESLDLAKWKRVVFYPLGAAEALLLDAAQPAWKDGYFTRPFYLEKYLD